MFLNIFKRALSLTEKDGNGNNKDTIETSACEEAADVELKETIYGK